MGFQQSAVSLNNTSLVTVGSNVTTAKMWAGGRGVLVVQATQYAPVVNLMCLGPNGSYLRVNSNVIAGDAIISFDLPAGQYQMHSATGTSIGLYAVLCPTP